MADYDRELIADMLDTYSAILKSGRIVHGTEHKFEAIREQSDLLTQADNRKSRARTVCKPDSAAPDGGVPDGWQIVPVEPNDEMLDAPNTIIQRYGAKLIWQRMLSAALLAPRPTTPIADASKPEQVESDGRFLDETIASLAKHCGAYIDGGDAPDYQSGYPGISPTISFTDRQLTTFVEKLLDGSYIYKDFDRGTTRPPEQPTAALSSPRADVGEAK